MDKNDDEVLFVGTAEAEHVEMYLKAIWHINCLLYTSPSPRDYAASRMPSSA